jgi:hypothetical protein
LCSAPLWWAFSFSLSPCCIRKPLIVSTPPVLHAQNWNAQHCSSNPALSSIPSFTKEASQRMLAQIHFMSSSRWPSEMAYLRVAVLGVAVLGVAVLGFNVLGSAVLHPHIARSTQLL